MYIKYGCRGLFSKVHSVSDLILSIILAVLRSWNSFIYKYSGKSW